MHRGMTFIGVFLLISVALAPLSAAADRPARLKIDPAAIQATTFYDGATVKVRAEAPTGYELAIVCSGQKAPIELRRKGKVLGLLWMNVGDVSFESLPTMYQLQTTAPLAELGSGAALDALNIGYPALMRVSEPKGCGSDTQLLFGELVKLKEGEGLFSSSPGVLKPRTESSDISLVETSLRIPAKAPPGGYQVRLVGFKDGHGQLLATAELKISQVGTAAFISSLASQHGLLYGILAAVIAVLVGLLTGFVFGLGSKGGH